MMTGPTTRIPAVLPRAPIFFGSGLTHAGRVRESNEDSILTDPSGVVWAIADGMGGYGHGDVASDIVIDCLSQLQDDALAAPELRMRLAEANREVLLRARNQRLDGMGATVVAMMIQNAIATVAWAGDCRAYLLRQGGLRLLTHDHTVVQDMIDQGLLDARDRDDHPERHIVTRAVGALPELEVDTVTVPLISGDRLMLCSDGLTTCIGDQQIASIINGATDPEDVCATLVTKALESGAPDNVSVIAVFARDG
ncbi:protein phosphatase [Ruegeria marina]|uniref:Protein phosphatase n=2 Tax=Ruegeria marina TaxID=639004 RepID=A0A1G7CXJ7_9RHOB|nr:protein phosphatase [Ruegeria marina]